jgi:hypothetical protein
VLCPHAVGRCGRGGGQLPLRRAGLAVRVRPGCKNFSSFGEGVWCAVIRHNPCITCPVAERCPIQFRISGFKTASEPDLGVAEDRLLGKLGL